MTSLRERIVDLSALYFGTPVVVLSTLNPDGSTNLAPLSSVWYLGDTAVLGMSNAGQSVQNLHREPQCVINLPSVREHALVERLAPLTGRNPVPSHKIRYRFEADKFAASGARSAPSDLVAPMRVANCPIHLEARVVAMHDAREGSFAIVEATVLRVHVDEQLVIPGSEHIDTLRWRPLFYVFRHYFGLGERLGRNFRAEY